MKVVIPLAGLGKRMRPHTHTRAKPMVRLAGRPILGHLLEWVVDERVDEVILIISPHQTDVEAYARTATSRPVRIVVQDEPRGQADAIARVAPFVDEPLLIVFSDTLADVTFDHLASVDADGLIYVKEIADPSRMGIIVVEDNRIVDMIEKPENPVSSLATIGMYYFKDHSGLFSAIDRVLAQPPRLQGEYFLADAIKTMIEDGKLLRPYIATVWEDTGTPEATLHAHRFVLERSGGQARPRDGVVFVPPVYVADDAEIRESVVGPYVTIEARCRVERSVLSDCILSPDVSVQNQVLERALLGERVAITGMPLSANLGDDSTVSPVDAEDLPTL
ncbi:MAG TPA: sugar phosphate nucleotidyltransferase [Chloroflexota bacterium]|nr:sugar phosphate nucleotidyltransferase [Chloroflexota bacterium]